MSHDTEKFEACGKLCAEHERLKPFEGTFRAEVRMWMGPGDPMVSTGTMKNQLVLGGRFLRHHYDGDPSDGPFPEFKGEGYFGYNTIDGRWEGMWIDNASTMMQTETGQVDAAGTTWEMHSEMTDPSSGHSMKKRSVITLKDDDHHSMEMYFETPQGEMKCMEIQYSRA